MSLLLDTHLLLWTAIAPKRLGAATLAMISDPTVAVFFSVVSVWETAIKRGRNRADFDVDPLVLQRALLQNGWRELVVTGAHAIAIRDLPPLHKDPFDRMLVAQAKVEGFTLLTSDKMVARYPGDIVCV